jgi:hypothetical protein
MSVLISAILTGLLESVMRAHGLKIVLGATLLAAFSAGIVPACAEAPTTKALKVANPAPSPGPPPAAENWTILQPKISDAKGFSVVKPGERADNFGGLAIRSMPPSSGGGGASSGGNNLSGNVQIKMPNL